MNNVLLIVDTRNIFNNLQRQFSNGKLDYKTFIERIIGTDHIYHQLAYGSQIGDKAYSFKTLLEKLGFVCKFTENGLQTTSPNVQMAIDATHIIAGGKIDRVILVTSDPDIIDLIHWVRNQGLKCEIVGCRVPRSLRDVASSYTELTSDLLLSL